VAISKDPSGVCLCLTERTLDEAAASLARERGRIQLAEVRADLLAPEELPNLASFAASRAEPLLLTVRLPRDGGGWRGTEEERAALLARCLSSRAFRFVDLEDGFDPPALRGAVGRGVRVIRSVHDFAGVPAGIAGIVRRLGERGEIPKVAVMPRGCADLARLLEAMREVASGGIGEHWIVLGMGEYGFPTRVLAARLGSLLTYCGVVSGGAAPGQVTPRELHELYRYPSLSPSSSVYGVIGNPVAHSQSPRIHNAGLAALGLDAVYLPFLVDDVGEFLRVAGMLGVTGVSVTVPHKLAVMPYLSRQDPGVARIGACNTMVREADGWHGTNTDWPGFLAPLDRRGELGKSARTRATVIGAGGAARAVVYALREIGAEVLILNRSPAGAVLMAQEFGCRAGPLGREGALLAAGFADLVVQTTSCGMEPRADCDPLPEYEFRGTEVVYELVYRPAVTPFLARARAAGCRWIGGMEMLLEQAYEQFRLFTGREYPRLDPPRDADEGVAQGYNG
jgi:3-dehydroquinate dehydratase / shikimate dehydrogenase